MTTKTSDYRELLIGCGNSREKRVFIPGREYETTPPWKNLTTLDIDPECKPDIVFDLCSIGWQHVPPPHSWICDPHEIPSNTFDEIHAYEVLEHCGDQGHHTLFFAQFREFWRILKPNGYFCATVPDYRSIWAWGDPSHTRIINAGTLVFLSQAQYAIQVGKTAMSDFRVLLGDANFDIVNSQTRGEQFQFVLRAIK